MPLDPRTDGAGQEGVWRLQSGTIADLPPADTYRPDGVEDLTHSSPYRLNLERVRFDGKIVYAVESGEVEIAFDEHRVAIDNKVAQEYQIVHAVELDDAGKPRGGEPEPIEGQLNIDDAVPGMDTSSPLWQFNHVVVPQDDAPNTLRSGADCLQSGYPIHTSTVVENRPVLE